MAKENGSQEFTLKNKEQIKNDLIKEVYQNKSISNKQKKVL